MNCLKYALLLTPLVLPSLSLHAATPRVDERISNVFLQKFRNEGFSYVVDPYAQLCFVIAHNGGVTEIDCAALQRRSEWQRIIYWLDEKEKN